MSISEKEWDEVRSLIYDVVNVSAGGGDSTQAGKKLTYKLDRLRLKYGELPLLLSTKADFIGEPDERLKLYKRAVELSQENLDIPCLTQSAESIAAIYVNELSDFHSGQYWLDKLKELIASHGDAYIIGNLSDLEANLNRLKIKGV